MSLSRPYTLPPALPASILKAIMTALVMALVMARGPASDLQAQGAELDGPRWTLPSALGPEAPDAVPADVDLIVDASEGVHAVWVGRRETDHGDTVYQASRPKGGQWNAPAIIAGGDGVRRADPVIAIDARSGLHVALVEIDKDGASIQHYYRRAAPNTGWSVPRQVDAFGAVRVGSPGIAGDRLGNIHVVWSDERRTDSNVLYRRRRSDGGWDEIQPVHDPLDGDQRQADLGITRDGAVWAVWEDSRSGRAEIWASVLPLASPVWWPDYPLTVAGRSGHATAPRVTGDGAGGVHAVWIESDGNAIAHSSRPEGAEVWSSPSIVHRPESGTALDVDIAGGAAGQVIVAWSETRPGESRLYSGVFGEEGHLHRSRIDRVPRFLEGQRPRLGLGSDAQAHVAWLGLDVDRLGAFHATAQLVEPEREWVELRGRLRFEPRVDACHGELYAVENCAGETIGYARPSGVELAPLLGRDVVVQGRRVRESPCEYVRADRASLEIGACPGIQSSVTGIVYMEEAPVEGARVAAGAIRAITGPSGRFFLDGLAHGSHTLTATLPCALSNVAPSITVNPRQTLRMEPAYVWAGDVVEDCRIDVRDLTRVGSHYRSRGETIGRCTDIDGDGVVSAGDLALVADRQGMGCARDWRVEDPILDALGTLVEFTDRLAPWPTPLGTKP